MLKKNFKSPNAPSMASTSTVSSGTPFTRGPEPTGAPTPPTCVSDVSTNDGNPLAVPDICFGVTTDVNSRAATCVPTSCADAGGTTIGTRSCFLDLLTNCGDVVTIGSWVVVI
ncbi:hypothetical protein ACIBKY_29465 [Nonomuraea sp. NPDC050394]|uniref:hypothetical protein n=1 Tax=Nonomuraea sp. NPDC050394 TaxID=3364363 RepID=UPI003791B7C4